MEFSETHSGVDSICELMTCSLCLISTRKWCFGSVKKQQNNKNKFSKNKKKISKNKLVVNNKIVNKSQKM